MKKRGYIVSALCVCALLSQIVAGNVVVVLVKKKAVTKRQGRKKQGDVELITNSLFSNVRFE